MYIIRSITAEHCSGEIQFHIIILKMCTSCRTFTDITPQKKQPHYTTQLPVGSIEKKLFFFYFKSM